MKKILIMVSLVLITTISFAQELVKFMGKGDKYGYYDKANKLGVFKPLIKPQYDVANSFNDDIGLAAVKLNDKWGMIDKTGATIIPFEYDLIEERLKGDKIHVVKGKKAGLIDKSGKVILPIEYDFIGDVSNEMLPVRKDTKYGFLTMSTLELSALKYDKVLVCIKGWFVQQNGKWALINLNQKELTPYKYDVMAQRDANFHYAEADGNAYKVSLLGVEEFLRELKPQTQSSGGSSSGSSAKKKDECTYKCKACNKVTKYSCSTTPGDDCQVLTQKAASGGGGRKGHEWQKQ